MSAGRWMGLGLVVAVVSGAWAQGDPARAFDAGTAAVRRPGTVVRVDLIGDSTQTYNAGYGRGFCANLDVRVDCVDMAKGGASTKTFRAQGLWERALATKPDYVVIQFGHNDVPSADHADRETTLAEYEGNLRRYVTEARAAEIKPVLVTPLARRYFDKEGKIHDDLEIHAGIVRKVAGEMGVPLIDLHKESVALLETIGEEKSRELAITKKDSAGKTVYDKTHLDWAGSYVFGRIVAADLGHAVAALAAYVRPDAAKLPPEGVKAMKVIGGGPVKIVLVGDSTVATEGGWGPGFCAVMTPNVTCVDVALNGRSSKSYYDEGAWKKALAVKGDYYLIQFGHNDMPGKGPERETVPGGSFDANLRRYIAETRAIGALPVLVTSLSRRTYKNGVLVQDLKAYADATRNVGAAENVTVVDLNAMSTAMLTKMTQEEADKFDAVAHADAKAEAAAVGSTGAKPDRTHLNEYGKRVFGRMVADQLIRTEVELGPDVVGEAKK